MREISTEKIKIGEHVLIDGVEYVAENADLESPCKGCAFENGPKPCPNFIECDGMVFVKVKKEPKYRPYNDTEEMIADWKERFNAKDWPSYSMPLIWVKNEWGNKYVLTGFSHKNVILEESPQTLQVLCRCYTYLDGSPCGKEVTEC